MSKKHKRKKHEDAPEETMTEGTVDVETEGADAAALEERIAELEKELEQARGEARDAADRALRTLAEFDNFRKRSRRENDEATGAGAAKVLTDLLQVADDLGRALEHAGADVPPDFLQGIRMVARSVGDLLDRHGVARIQALGAVFDPRVHEALSSVPAADGMEPNTVLHEVQAGYVQGERVLRPARVVVTRAAEPPVAAADEPAEQADSAPGDEESGDAA